MRQLDYFLRNWRYRMIEPHIPKGCTLLDVGGYDGSLLIYLYNKIEKGICIDPLIDNRSEGKIEFIKYLMKDRMPFPDSSFDVVTMLAVYEHLLNRESITSEIFRILKDNGLALLTVPSSAVDSILKILLKMRLIDGMSLEEHHHFNSYETIEIFEQRGFALKKWSRFQMGLNNLFIFQKRS